MTEDIDWSSDIGVYSYMQGAKVNEPMKSTILVLLCYKHPVLRDLPARVAPRLIWKRDACRPSKHSDG
jgi:hypothetical protein